VLRRGVGRKSYGETLLDVGARQSGYIGSVAAMSESRSFLEQRIKLIMSTSTKRWQLLGAALGLLSLGLFAVAAEVSPPNTGRPNAGNADSEVQVKVPESVLQSYVGYYQLNGNVVQEITRKGDQLFAQLTGQQVAEIYPSSNNEFFYKIVKARITFVTEGSGPATSLVLHQNGFDKTMPRIDPGVAQQINAALKAKVQAQTASPGTAEAVRMMLEGHETGNPPYSRMSPELAKAVREQLPRSGPVFKQLGPVKSIEFKGVGNQGWDIYDVRFENGTAQYRIILSDDGTVIGAMMTMMP
jgi:bla regulator protein blaR1